MTQNIFNIIRESVINSANARIEMAKDHVEKYSKKNIGAEIHLIMQPKVRKKIEFINPKTGRVNHRTVMEHPSYIYTEEHYNKEMENAIAKAKQNHSLSYQVNTDDSTRSFYFENIFDPTEDEINRIYEAFGDFADHLIGFEIKSQWYVVANPVFDKETNDLFWNSREEYMKKKAAWCEKYGCE